MGTFLEGPIFGKNPMPQPGDCTLWKWNKQKVESDPYFCDHVSIVYSVSGKDVHGISGNVVNSSGSWVKWDDHTYNDARILGYYRPNWNLVQSGYSVNKLLQFLQEVEKHVGENGDWSWKVSGLARGEHWCVAFINACAKTVGGLDRIITVKYTTGTIKEGLDNGGGTWIPGPIHGQTPTPQPGDLIEYSWDCDIPYGTDYTGDHIAVVTEVNGDTITTIGGNESGSGGPAPWYSKVRKSTKSITYGCILGYYRPNWSLVGGMLTSAYGGYNLKYTHLNDRNDAMIRDVCYLDSSYNLSLSNSTGIEISAVNYTTMLVGLLAMIGDPINPSVSYASVNTGLSGTNADGSGIENANARNIFSLLTGKGLNAAQAIGILANIQRESSFNPGSVGDNGTSFGLCQWHAGRGASMKSYCGADWATDISGQIDYLFVELNGGYSEVFSSIKSECSLETEDSAKRAAEIFVRRFEIPADVDNEVIIRQGYVSTLWSQIVVTGTSNYSTLSAPATYTTTSSTTSSQPVTTLSVPSSSGGQFYIQDSQLEVPADPTYFGHRVTNITAEERAAIIWTIDGEFGADLTGAILIAQVVRDIHDYTKMHGAPATITYEYVIRNAFAQPYWQKGVSDPNYDFTKMEANRRYSYKAFQYVFEQGNSAVRHKLAFEGTAEVDFSIYQAYVVYKYYLRSWGILWSGFVWGLDIYGDYVNPDSASDMLLRSSSDPGTSGITSGEITYTGIPVTPATTPEEFRDMMRERVVSLLKTGSVGDSATSSSSITDEEFVVSISHPDAEYHGRPIDLTDKQRKRIAFACLGEFSIQSSGMYEVWCCLCQYIRDRVDYKGRSYDGIGASWLGRAYSTKVQSSYGNKSYDEIVEMHPDLGKAITHVFDDGGSAFQGFCGGYADKNDEASARRYGYLDKNGIPGCVRYVMWTTDCDDHENDHDLISLDKYTNADDNLWFYACWPGKATHLRVPIGTYKNGWRGGSEDSNSEYYSSSDVLSPKEHTIRRAKEFSGTMKQNVDDIYNVLVDGGLKPVAAIGVLSNIGIESGFIAKLGFTTDLSGGIGYTGGAGLLMWEGQTPNSIIQYCRDHNYDPLSEIGQAHYILASYFSNPIPVSRPRMVNGQIVPVVVDKVDFLKEINSVPDTVTGAKQAAFLMQARMFQYVAWFIQSIENMHAGIVWKDGDPVEYHGYMLAHRMLAAEFLWEGNTTDAARTVSFAKNSSTDPVVMRMWDEYNSWIGKIANNHKLHPYIYAPGDTSYWL